MATTPQHHDPTGTHEAVAAEIAARLERGPDNLADWFEAQAMATPDASLLVCDGHHWSYAAIDRYADRIAHAAGRLGLQSGATSALVLANSVEALAAIIGLAKLGIGLSMLDPALTGASLSHALSEVPPVLVIAEEAVADAIATDAPLVLRSEDGQLRHAGAPWLADEAGNSPADPAKRSGIAPSDTLFHIFTSGTTGLPKAARCSHARYIASATSEAVILGIHTPDRVYVVLPMFHIAALSAIGAAISVGGSVLLRRRFSASAFWNDVRRYHVTALQYLGEIARYVAARPPAPNDRQHGLRAMMGAGLKADVWRAFRDRFGVPRIVECYGSSEGVCNLINLDGRIGSVGKPPPGARLRIVRLAEDGHALAYNADRMLLDCAVDEAGELVGALADEGTFEGYASAGATRARIVREGRSERLWFRTGDLFRRDADGYFYFLDRIGDNYRWKGENISTEQVSAVIRESGGIASAIVYGVRVPGADGRAGMALIEPAPGARFDPAHLAAALRAQLAPAALPVFLRIGAAGDLTATYKVRLGAFVAEGYDPAAIADPLYLLDAAGCYVPLDAAALARNRLAPFGSDAD